MISQPSRRKLRAENRILDPVFLYSVGWNGAAGLRAECPVCCVRAARRLSRLGFGREPAAGPVPESTPRPGVAPRPLCWAPAREPGPVSALCPHSRAVGPHSKHAPFAGEKPRRVAWPAAPSQTPACALREPSQVRTLSPERGWWGVLPVLYRTLRQESGFYWQQVSVVFLPWIVFLVSCLTHL